MQLTTEDIRNGAGVGLIVWICHYHRPDLDKKALRNVSPTLVMVRDTDDLPKNKTVYYSKTYFSPLNKHGKPTAKVISPVDNTGYRWRPGTELFVFTSEKECRDEWNRQLKFHMGMIDVMIKHAAENWQNQKDKLVGMLSV